MNLSQQACIFFYDKFKRFFFCFFLLLCVCVYVFVCPKVLFFFSNLGEYEQNICGARNVSCLSCPERLPSCKELSDGYHVFGNQTWTNRYIECYKKRTVSIHRCPVQQIFHPKQLKCVLKFHGGIIVLFKSFSLFYTGKPK